jgi:hypothetical protein
MTQMRKALFLPFNRAIAVALGLGTLTHSDMSGAQALRRGRQEVNPARQARETPI